jgi:hypothetical protein
VFTEPGQVSFGIESSVCFTTLYDKVDAIAVAGREADARHCASLSLLQATVSEIAEKSERQIAGVMKVSMGSHNVQKNEPADYHAVECSIRLIGVKLRFSDIDHCNQLNR